MIYYADKNKKYVGSSNHGMIPEGAVHETKERPTPERNMFDVENDCWISSPEKILKLMCIGITKAGTSCKHHATHGAYCRQHVGQK